MTVVNHELLQLLKDCSIALNTPVCLLNHQKRTLYQFPEGFRAPPEELKSTLDKDVEHSYKIPYSLHFCIDVFEQCFFLYSIKTTNDENATIAVGPFLQQEMGRTHIRKAKEKQHLSTDEQELFLYFEQQPLWKPYQVPVLERVLSRLLPSKPGGEWKQEHSNVSYKTAYSDFSNQYVSSTIAEQWRSRFFNSFRNGDGQTMELYKEYKANDTADLGNGNTLRSEKNRMIRLVTELTHLSTEVGGPHGEMILLNEFYINFLETITSPDELAELEQNIIYSFYQRLHQSDKPRYSPIIERARHYIFQHLSDELSLKDVAKEINVHKGYLSSVFKKEVGEPVSQYINRLRIKEAKELLSITDYSLLEISSMLGYNSQSYFTRVFKQVEGIGPKEFRIRYKTNTKG